MTVILPILLTFASCCSNVIFLEFLIKFSPGCGELVTFLQFLFISTYGFVRVSKFGSVPPKVPIREYLFSVMLFYGSSICGNLAFGCHISMPIQMIFKSGSVLASMSLGVLLLNRKYSFAKYVSVVMITVGIAMCLLVSQNKKKVESENVDSLTWLFGIFLLTASLFMGARLGVSQEQIATKYGKHPRESSFYLHALALPAFLFFYKKIYTQAILFLSSEQVEIPVLGVHVPYVLLFLIGNILTQFVCVRSVYWLASEIPALSVTVVLTLRKFISLVISIFYFRNPFTVYHWCGTFLVFTGTLMFAEVLQKGVAFIRGEQEGGERKKKE